MGDHDTIPVRTRLDAPHGETPTPTRRVLNGFFRRQGSPAEAPTTTPYFGADHFGLQRVGVFRQATWQERQQVLLACSGNLLNEAYFIEKAGMAFCAKMVLLSQTTEARQIYSLIGADEATHLQWISAYVDAQVKVAAPDVFNQFLSQLIEIGDRNSLAYILQIILEGWGITHYQSLAAGCKDAGLKAVLLRIVHDEALHHASGRVLFDPKALTPQQRAFILDTLATFLQMIRRGPQATVAALEQIKGSFGPRDRLQAFEALETERVSQEKLTGLRSLMKQPEMTWAVEALDQASLFNPCTPAECAAVGR